MASKPLSDDNDAVKVSREVTEAIFVNPKSCFYGATVNILEIIGVEKIECLVRLPDGTRTTVPIEWTDYEVPPNINTAEMGGGSTSRLNLDILREVVEIINDIKRSAD